MAGNGVSMQGCQDDPRQLLQQAVAPAGKGFSTFRPAGLHCAPVDHVGKLVTAPSAAEEQTESLPVSEICRPGPSCLSRLQKQ